ncbi:MAG TPA: proprotein convertase P-domain-containing protein, partial [Nannocystaceae bacterium]|nr:proprotein convertase P-domain-containing protein [Nannocystaceae bacterium]
LCVPAWMRGTFVSSAVPDVTIPDGSSVVLELPVYGLATVDTDVEIDLWIEHSDPSQLRVTLTNPAGTEVELHTNEPDAFIVDGPVLGFSGDESVDGDWTLRIVDDTAGTSGVLDRWSLRLGSRFD